MFDISYYLSDDYADTSKFWQKTKYIMCGNHRLGNILAPLWLTTSCTCCSFFRGVLFGIVFTGFITCLI